VEQQGIIGGICNLPPLNNATPSRGHLLFNIDQSEASGKLNNRWGMGWVLRNFNYEWNEFLKYSAFELRMWTMKNNMT